MHRIELGVLVDLIVMCGCLTKPKLLLLCLPRECYITQDTESSFYRNCRSGTVAPDPNNFNISTGSLHGCCRKYFSGTAFHQCL